MARRRFFVEGFSGSRAELTGAAAQHLQKVLRVERGQHYELSDNRTAWLAEVAGFAKNAVVFELKEQLPAEVYPARIELLAALIKFDHWEWMIEKATELGVERIVPLITGRSEHGLEKAVPKRAGRWQRILVESAQQCRRTRLPEIGEPVRLETALRHEADIRLFLAEAGEHRTPFLAALSPVRRPEDRVALLCGPEGGWTETEQETIRASGWQPVSLGPLVLRAETAALAAVAIVTAAWSADPAPGS